MVYGRIAWGDPGDQQDSVKGDRAMKVRFWKAHGLSNDFVILDGDACDVEGNVWAKQWSDRRRGIGFDQLLIYYHAVAQGYRVSIYNADGSSAENCGNGLRCLAKLLMSSSGVDSHLRGNDSTEQGMTIGTPAGPVCCYKDGEDIGVTMPKPTWQTDIDIMAQNNVFTHPPVYVEVGNPHLVCFVRDLEELEDFGPILSKHPHFPAGVNVSFASVRGNDIVLRVWERGVGPTPACGSGACATVVAAQALGLVDHAPTAVHQPGGTLRIHWREGKLDMIGPAEVMFEGIVKQCNSSP